MVLQPLSVQYYTDVLKAVSLQQQKGRLDCCVEEHPYAIYTPGDPTDANMSVLREQAVNLFQDAILADKDEKEQLLRQVRHPMSTSLLDGCLPTTAACDTLGASADGNSSFLGKGAVSQEGYCSTRGICPCPRERVPGTCSSVLQVRPMMLSFVLRWTGSRSSAPSWLT